MTRLLALLLLALACSFLEAFRAPISCFHCASLEYRPLFQRFSHLNSAYRSSMNFGNFCDSHYAVHQTAPASSCEYACVTIFEPQFIGGIMNTERPYAFIRGCATDVFAFSDRRPAEIDFLHRSEICLSVPLNQIWPDSLSNDLVHVCSCTSNGCNLHDAISASALRSLPIIAFLPPLLAFLVVNLR